MESGPSFVFENEVEILVERLNSNSPLNAASIIGDTDQVLSEIETGIPSTKQGIDWSQAKISSGPCFNTSSSQELERILADFMRGIREIGNVKTCAVVSDGFYLKGVRCTPNSIAAILKDWLCLPHAIYISCDEGRMIHVINFARSSFVFITH